MIPNPTRVVVKPLEELRKTARPAPMRIAEIDGGCIGGHPDPVWPDGRFTVGLHDVGPLCVACAPQRVEPYVLHVIDAMNAASEALEEAPAGFQDEVGDRLLQTLVTVLRDHGVIA